MKTKRYFAGGVVVAAFAAVLSPTGCGGSGGTGASTSSSTSGTTSSTGGMSSSSTGPSSSTTSMGAGGAGGAGGGGTGGAPAPTPNTTPATAISVTINPMAPTTGVAQDAMTPDYFTFMGTKGERVLISAQAVSIVMPAPAANEAYIIDTVVTLYDANMNQLAQDDDAWPRFDTDSALFTELPATGTYYYTVQDCNAAFGASGCNPPKNITDFEYQTFVADADKLTSKEFYAGTSQDGTTAKAVPLAYTVSSGAAGFDIIDGDNFTAGKPQVFSFVPPASITVAKGSRLRTEVWLQPYSNKNGDGSGANVTMWVTDQTGTTILVKADQANYKDGDNFGDGPLDLSVPVTAGSTYYLFVQDDNASPFPADYYFANHVVDYGNPIQTGTTNISAATAQVLTIPSGSTNSYFVDGNIAAPATSYWFEVDPPAKTSQVSVTCSSARAGSGVQGFAVDLQAQAGTGTPATIVPSGMSTTESTSADLVLPSATSANGFPFPSGTTKLFLVLSGTGQSATVTDTSFQCGVFYQ